MAKYTSEGKLQAALRYLDGKESSTEIAESMGTNHAAILKWARLYEHHGVEAFIKRYTNYTVQFKLDVLNYMIEHGTSSRETAAIFNIPTPSTLDSWKKQFETKGPDALQSRKKGRLSMKKETKRQLKQAPVEGSSEALQARIKQLEMENEYLKKLNALVQDKEISPKKTR
ncbi:transposase [Ureibacillus manganicus DSM 26584]|uniref:Transposase n=1 Tax=Ureibacillus manganicus DSM 26584 TaxID=1384049 RepID=A0A0A3I662_9BACL|nr:transposase [Ureibacillus manganicus DSM 26584]